MNLVYLVPALPRSPLCSHVMDACLLGLAVAFFARANFVLEVVSYDDECSVRMARPRFIASL